MALAWALGQLEASLWIKCERGLPQVKADLQGWARVGLSRASHAMREPVEAAFGSNWSDPARGFRLPQGATTGPRNRFHSLLPASLPVLELQSVQMSTTGVADAQ